MPVSKEGILQIAIIATFEVYKFTRMLFRLQNCVETFQRLVDKPLQGLLFIYAHTSGILITNACSGYGDHVYIGYSKDYQTLTLVNFEVCV